MSHPSRVGIGYDIHRLVGDRKLVLGGIEIPFDKGLLGHSDSDVLSHAICDALLGAAALGDIGTHFPNTDDRFEGISSLDMLAQIVAKIAERGYSVLNVDSIVVAEQPKLAPHIPSMRGRLAEVLGIDLSRVSVKAKTNEGLDSVGRTEAIAAHAVAILSEQAIVE